jgi:hypothetical protein
VPLNIDFVIHRYGEWIMLMLGESVLSLLVVDVNDGFNYYAAFFSGIVSIILLEYLHFRSQPHDPDEHALRRSRYAGVGFYILMQIYSCALVILGTSYKMFLYEFLYEDESVSEDTGTTGRRSLQNIINQRFLAGSSDVYTRFDTEDRRQRIAYMFSGSLATVWLSLDIRYVISSTCSCVEELTILTQPLSSYFKCFVAQGNTSQFGTPEKSRNA